jgi:predicted acetyltransferase
VTPRSRPPALRYRAARPGDVETLAAVGQLAYRVSSLEQRLDFYTAHPRFALSDVRVAELGGHIVASLVLYPLTAWVRGRHVPLTGVGSVAVLPEHRRQGVGEALLRSALREMRRSGRALSVLYAFRGSYYRKLGYGVAEIVHQLAVGPANLPLFPERRAVRRLRFDDRPAVEALYARSAAAGHFALERRPEWWARRLWDYPGDWMVHVGAGGRLEGYVHYEMDTTHGAFQLGLTLTEFVAASPAARRGLIGHLASLADQVNEIHHVAPADNLWLATLRTAQNLHPGAEMGVMLDSGGVAHGAMLRVTDVPAALGALPLAPRSRGEVVLAVEDAVLPQNALAWRVRARASGLDVAPATRAEQARLPRLTVPSDRLGPLLAGTLSPTGAAEAGLIESDGGAEMVESWFRARPVFLHPMNVF